METPFSAYPSPKISRVIRWFLGLVILLLLAWILLFTWPMNGGDPGWLVTFQADLRLTTAVIAPYLFVGVLGGLIGIAELVSTFKTYPREALLTQWAWVLIFANVLAAMVAMLILRATMPQMELWLQILAVGLGFQGIIRTRFVLAKQVGARGEGEVAVNLGWLYDQFSNLARRQIDLELMNNRRTAVTHLITYYPSLAELYDIALYTITARETLTDEEERSKREELEKLIDPKAPEQFAKASVALLILENGGQAYVDLLLSQAMDGAVAQTPPTLSQDRVVRQLVDQYDLEGLVQLTGRLTQNEKIRRYVQAAAQPDPSTSTADQKATIAHFLVQQLGKETVHQASASS